MLRSSELLEEIIEYFSILIKYIELNNDIGNFDFNRKSEDFFCGLLNLVYKLNLENLNKLKMNFPAIDLGDKEKRICFQVTTNSTFGKIKETLDKYCSKKLYEDFDFISILIIGDKGKHRKEIEYVEFDFSYKDNLLDTNDIVKEISKMKTKELYEIFKFIKAEYSNKIIEKIKMLKEDKSLYIDEIIVRDKHICYYTYGLGKVRIDAYLPVSIEEKLSCLISFQQPGLSDCMFTFEEDQIRKILFNDHNSGFSEKRKFILNIDSEKVGIQFPNNRFITDVQTAEQLCILISCLYEKYLLTKRELYQIIGAINYEEINQGEFNIIRTPLYLWTAMVDFAQKHDHFYGNTQWDIFHPLNLQKKDHIIIYKNHLNKIKADILAELFVRDINKNYVDIVWKAGYTPLIDKMDGFNNEMKWKVDYTHNWILEEFIPYIFYLNGTLKKTVIERLFKKETTFEEFRSKFNYSNYKIQSLYRENNKFDL